MPFDINAARQSGYSDSEIQSYLAQNHPNFDVNKAVSSGYSLDDISKELSNPTQEDPGVIKSAAAGFMSGVPLAETAIASVKAIGPTTYEEEHQKLEDLKTQAWEQHPVAYGAGKVGGFAATAYAAPVSLPGAVVTGMGYGVDAATKPADMISDAVKGGVVGGVTHGVVSAVAPKVIQAGKALAKSGMGILGASKPVIERYMENPKAVMGALSNEEAAEKLGQTLTGVSRETKDLSAKATGLLSREKFPTSLPIPEEGAEKQALGLLGPSGEELGLTTQATGPATTIEDILTPAVDKLKATYQLEGIPVTAADRTTLAAIDNQMATLGQIAATKGGVLSEQDFKPVVQKLQKMVQTAFDNPDVSATKEGLKNLSGVLNGILKKSNPQYGAAMEPVAERAGLLSDLGDKLALKSKMFPGEEGQFNVEYTPTEKTNVLMGKLTNDPKTETQDLLGHLKEIYPESTNFLQNLNDKQIQDILEGRIRGGGLRQVGHVLGYTAGRLADLPGGGLVGSIFGGEWGSQLNGGQVAKWLMDKYMEAGESQIAPALKKYGPILVNAAKQGGNALASTYFVLATSHPEFQEAIQHAQENMPR